MVTETDEIVKEVYDESKVPAEVVKDPVTFSLWKTNETNRIEQEYQERLAGKNGGKEPEQTNPKNEEEPEVPVMFSAKDFEELKEYKSPEEVKTALQNILKQAKEHGASKPELDAIKTELAEAKAKLEQKPKNIFTDPLLYKLDKFKATKPGSFETVLNLQFGKTTDFDVLKMEFLNDNPEFKEDDELVTDLLNKKYNLETEYYEGTANDVEKKEHRLAMAQMKIDAKAAKTKLLKELNEITVPESEIPDPVKEKEREDKLKADLRKEWSTITPKFAEAEVLTKLPLRIPEKDEEGHNIKGKFKYFTEYSAPEAVRKDFADKALDFLVENKMPLNEESIRTVYSIMVPQYFYDNRDFIIDAAVEKRNTMNKEEFLMKYRRPSAAEKREPKPPKNDGNIGQKEMTELKNKIISGKF